MLLVCPAHLLLRELELFVTGTLDCGRSSHSHEARCTNLICHLGLAVFALSLIGNRDSDDQFPVPRSNRRSHRLDAKFGAQKVLPASCDGDPRHPRGRPLDRLHRAGRLGGDLYLHGTGIRGFACSRGIRRLDSADRDPGDCTCGCRSTDESVVPFSMLTSLPSSAPPSSPWRHEINRSLSERTQARAFDRGCLPSFGMQQARAMVRCSQFPPHSHVRHARSRLLATRAAALEGWVRIERSQRTERIP